jgi:RNA polymerase sigma factor (sigma-70 family)
VATTLEDLLSVWLAAPSPAEAERLERAILDAAWQTALRAAQACRLERGDAEDIAQEAGRKFLREVRRQREALHKPQRLMWTIAHNLALDLLRKRKRDRTITERYERELAAGAVSENAESIWLARERQLRVQKIVATALAEAPPNYRRALRRRYLDGVTNEELAEEYYLEVVAAGGADPTDAQAVEVARRHARYRADTHLSRGLKWLRERLADLIAEGDA